MRALIPAVVVLAVLANANAARAGLSSTPRDTVASAETTTPPETTRPVRTERRAHHPRPHGIGGPIGAIGGAIGGLFHR